jgi:hypothetical protein
MSWEDILKVTAKGRRVRKVIRTTLRPVIQEMVEDFTEGRNEIERAEVENFINSNSQELKDILYERQEEGPNQDPALEGYTRMALGNTYRGSLPGLINIAIVKLKEMGYEQVFRRVGGRRITIYVLRN